MNINAFSQSQLIAIIFIAGFAIQEALQIMDPAVSWAIARFKNSQAGRTFLGSGSDGDFKKAVMSSLAFGLGAITVGFTHIQLLSYIRPEWGGGAGDFLISALVVGSGTEAVNTVLKFFGYLKDSQSPATRLALTQAVKRSQEVDSMTENTPLQMMKGDPMPPRTPEDVYKEKLQNRVRLEKDNPTLVIDFKNGNLNQHMADDGQAQVVVLLSTSDSADEFGKVLNGKGTKTVRDNITRNTAYADAIGVMDTAVSEGSGPKEPA